MLPIQGGNGFLQGGNGSSVQNAAPWSGALNTVQNTAPAGVLNTGSFPSAGHVLGASTTTAAPVDPYAGTPFGSTAGYNQAVSDYQGAKSSTLNSISDAIGGSATGYKSSIQDYLDSRKQQQNSIDNQSVQNELAREQGLQGITDMVGNGIRSGGVTLANSNAGTSSAGEALARAYGTIGRQQASSVGNQFAQGQAGIQTSEDNLLASDATQLRHTSEDKVSTINSIVNSARQQLGSLNQSAATASLPDRVNIESKIAEIKQQAMDALSSYDSQLSGGIAGQGPESSDQVRAKANGLLTSGVAPENAFNYTTEAPAQFQDTGQFASSLPIFTSSRRDNQ